MRHIRTIKSRAHDYTVEEFGSSNAALAAAVSDRRPHMLIDRAVYDLLDPEVRTTLPVERTVLVEATETAKSYAALEPVFLDLLGRGLRRNGVLVVVGGGVLQDAGCFIASVLSRGVRWELVPTTLLAQADSCIGSKSSINIGSYKNQLGTFYPPHRILLSADFLQTLPFDEIRSGLGEVIKLQLLSSQAGFDELMNDLEGFRALSRQDQLSLLAKWVMRSLDVKQPFIEKDEFDTGPRLLLNYGHTFGHAFESVTNFGIPHGIAVILGMVTATVVSARLGAIADRDAVDLARRLQAWHTPYADELASVDMQALFAALSRDKKNTTAGLTCILTRGCGRMERTVLSAAQVDACVAPALTDLISCGFTL
jgi:3-dehydroquinate synthase